MAHMRFCDFLIKNCAMLKAVCMHSHVVMWYHDDPFESQEEIDWGKRRGKT